VKGVHSECSYPVGYPFVHLTCLHVEIAFTGCKRIDEVSMAVEHSRPSERNVSAIKTATRHRLVSVTLLLYLKEYCTGFVTPWKHLSRPSSWLAILVSFHLAAFSSHNQRQESVAASVLVDIGSCLLLQRCFHILLAQ